MKIKASGLRDVDEEGSITGDVNDLVVARKRYREEVDGRRCSER